MIITHVSLSLSLSSLSDDDMISIASMMSMSNISTIGNLEDDDDFTITTLYVTIIIIIIIIIYTHSGTGRSISPVGLNEPIPSVEELIEWSQNVTQDYSNVNITNMTTSWRNGLGFCAIIHHYRSDLL